MAASMIPSGAELAHVTTVILCFAGSQLQTESPRSFGASPAAPGISIVPRRCRSNFRS